MENNKENASNSEPSPSTPAYPHYQGAGYPGYSHPSYGAPYYEEEDTFLGNLSPQRILRVARRKWPTIALVALIALALAYGYLHITTPVYRATSMIEMTVRPPRIMAESGAVVDEGTRPNTEDVFNTRLTKFRSGDFRSFAKPYFQDALKSAGITLNKEWLPEDADRDEWIPEAEFELIKDTYLVEISVEHPDREVAQLAANAYAEATRANVIDENRSVSDNAVDWLEQQADKQVAELEKTDDRLAEFRAENNISVLENRRDSTDKALASFNEKLTALEAEAVQLRELNRFFSGEDLTPELATQLPEKAAGREEIGEILMERRELVAEKERLDDRYTASHPQLVEIEQRLESIDDALKENLQRMRARSENNMALLDNQIEQLEMRIEEQGQQAVQLDRTLAKLKAQRTALERERDAKDKAYSGILERIQQARASADENTATVKITSLAGIPEAPVFPQPLRVWAIALVLGLGGGLGIALLVDTMEDKVSGLLDVENTLGIPVLGVVPHVNRGERPDLALSSFRNKFGLMAESFAGIRAIINSPKNAENARTILVCSTAPEEGKTVTAANLALSSAVSGKKTLLVDFDLRRPRLRRIFDLDVDTESLLQYLNEDKPEDFPHLPAATECPNLEVVCSRTDKDVSPAEILGSNQVKEFIDWAASRYDRVILDSAPYGLVSDAAVLAGLVSGVVFVLRPDRSRRHAAIRAIKDFNDLGVNILGAIVNDVSPGKGLGSSPYYYYDHKSYAKAYKTNEEDDEAAG